MTWTKLSDDFPDDCYRLSDAAFRLHVEGLCWSNRKLLDLCLNKSELRRWAARPEAVAELLDAGWWSDEGDHYVIRHHGSYQRTREQVLKQQAANQRNGAKGGKAPRERFGRNAPSEEPSSESLSESLSERDGTGRDGTGYQGEQDQNGRNGSPFAVARGAK
jgi:hypothetical protein